MIYQKLLLRFWSLPLLRSPGYRILRGRVWRVEGGPGAGLKLRFPQNADYILGTSEPPVQAEIARRLSPGDVFYDVGANMGYFSLISGRRVGSGGRVCAFEPHPRNARMIRENARLNGLGQIDVFEVALGRNSRRETLLMTEWDGGAMLASSQATTSSPVTSTEVQVVSLDEFILAHQLPVPTFVKIDVEGAELEVIEGMTATIARYAPTLLYEIDDGDAVNFHRRWDALDARVADLGYDVTRLAPSYPDMNWNVGHSLALPMAARRQ